MLNEEPAQSQDLQMMGMLHALGIEKGKDFKPDVATGHLRIFLLLASAYDGNHRGRGGDLGWRHPMMQGLRRQSE